MTERERYAYIVVASEASTVQYMGTLQLYDGLYVGTVELEAKLSKIFYHQRDGVTSENVVTHKLVITGKEAEGRAEMSKYFEHWQKEYGVGIIEGRL